MAQSIPITGLAANDPVPGVYVDLNFAAGLASLGNTVYGALLIGNMLPAGTATAGTVVYGPTPASPVQLQQESDWITLFGQGSELHRMFRRFIAVNQNTPLYAIAVTQSGGAAATQAVTFTTTATANGTARTYLTATEYVDTAITSGDTPTVIAANVALSVNTQANWPFTATSSLGVLTLTARQNGLRGNWLRSSTVIIGSIGTTSSITAQAFFTGGTTADSSTTALGTIAAQRYYYIVSSAEDATQFGALASQVASQGLPTTGIRQRCFAGSVDTEGNAQTIAVGVNQARAEIVWMQNSDWTPAELAANQCAVYSFGELAGALSGGMICNWDNTGRGSDAIDNLWFVPPPRSGTTPSRSTLKTALNNGLTPISIDSITGKTYLVMRATTRSLTNAVNDYRIRDGHKVSICDFYCDDASSKISLQFAKCVIQPDPVIGQRVQQPQSGKKVVTPRMVKAALNKLTQDYGDANMLQNVAQIQADTFALQEANPKTRMTVKVPLQTCDVAHQFGISVDQVA